MEIQLSKTSNLQNKHEKDIRDTLLNVYLAVFVVSVISSLALLFYTQKDLYSIWSFQVSDPPWLPPGIAPTNIVGPHTFGDFQLPYTLALDSNPYGWSFYNVTMPLGFILFSILTILPIKTATFVFLIGGLLFFAKVLRDYFGNSRNSLIFTNIFLFFSLPILICLDRGGLQIIALAFMFKGLYLCNKKADTKSNFENVMKYLYLAIAVSMKIYLIIPIALIMIIEKKTFEFSKKFLTIFISTNFVLSFFYGGPLNVIRGLIQGYLFQTGESDPGWIYGGVSLSKFFASLYFYGHTFTESMAFATDFQNYVFVPGVLYILFITSLIIRQPFSKNYKIVISLSTVFLVTPVSGAYTLTVTSFMAALIFNDLSQFSSFRMATKLRYFALTMVIFTSMLPIPTKYYLTIIPGLWIIHLCGLIVFAIYDKIISRTRKSI